MVQPVTTAELEERAKALRKTAIMMIYEAKSGHPGGSLSAADIVANLYYREIRFDPANPKWADRDRFVLSKGHVAPIQYAALAHLGFVPFDTVHTLRKLGSPFQGHPDSKKCPGIEISTGSLGQGVSAAVGMAIGLKRDGRGSRVYALVGDGETQEGQVWEAIQCANTYKLDNFTVIIDENNLQIDGHCDEISPNLDFVAKLMAFGYDVERVDGHDMQAVSDAFDRLRSLRNGRPKALIANTVKGKGVSYMEDIAGWHGAAPDDEQYAQAVIEIEKGLRTE